MFQKDGIDRVKTRARQKPDLIINLLLGAMILIGAAIAYIAYDSFESQTLLQNEGRIVQGIIDWITPENFTSTETNALGVGGGLALSLLAAFAVIYFRLRPMAEQQK